MNNTFGFIGTGNMGGALARAVAKVARPEVIWLTNKTQAKAAALAAELGCRAVSTWQPTAGTSSWASSPR